MKSGCWRVAENPKMLCERHQLSVTNTYTVSCMIFLISPISTFMDCWRPKQMQLKHLLAWLWSLTALKHQHAETASWSHVESGSEQHPPFETAVHRPAARGHCKLVTQAGEDLPLQGMVMSFSLSFCAQPQEAEFCIFREGETIAWSLWCLCRCPIFCPTTPVSPSDTLYRGAHAIVIEISV